VLKAHDLPIWRAVRVLAPVFLGPGVRGDDSTVRFRPHMPVMRAARLTLPSAAFMAPA
jgi:hypothetical protein